MTKLFEATWGAGYYIQETRNISMADIAEDNGYPEENILIVDTLRVGDTANLSDMSGEHYIKRIK